MSPSLERELRDRLDFSRPLPLDQLSGYIGQSSLADAVARRGTRTMDRDLARPRQPRPVTPSAARPARPKNAWKRGVPRSAAAKAKQAESMVKYYQAKGVSPAPGPTYMREYRAKQRQVEA